MFQVFHPKWVSEIREYGRGAEVHTHMRSEAKSIVVPTHNTEKYKHKQHNQKLHFSLFQRISYDNGGEKQRGEVILLWCGLSCNNTIQNLKISKICHARNNRIACVEVHA